MLLIAQSNCIVNDLNIDDIIPLVMWLICSWALRFTRLNWTDSTFSLSCMQLSYINWVVWIEAWSPVSRWQVFYVCIAFFHFIKTSVLTLFEHLQPLFPGESSVDQLVEIIKVCIKNSFFISICGIKCKWCIFNWNFRWHNHVNVSLMLLEHVGEMILPPSPAVSPS